MPPLTHVTLVALRPLYGDYGPKGEPRSVLEGDTFVTDSERAQQFELAGLAAEYHPPDPSGELKAMLDRIHAKMQPVPENKMLTVPENKAMPPAPVPPKRKAGRPRKNP